MRYVIGSALVAAVAFFCGAHPWAVLLLASLSIGFCLREFIVIYTEPVE